MKAAENWKAGIAMICVFMPIIMALIINVSSMTSFLLMWSLFFVGGLVLYKIIIKTVVVKSPCLNHDLTFWASSPPTNEHRIIFNFDSEEYAQTFASLNLAELENNAELINPALFVKPFYRC